MSGELMNSNLDIKQDYLNSTVNGIISLHSTGSASYREPFILRHGIPLSLYRYTDDFTIEAHTYGYPTDGDGGSGAPGLLYQTLSYLILPPRSEEHTSELQSRGHLVCRLLLEKKKTAD